jgi:hypothetical protein
MENEKIANMAIRTQRFTQVQKPDSTDRTCTLPWLRLNHGTHLIHPAHPSKQPPQPLPALHRANPGIAPAAACTHSRRCPRCSSMTPTRTLTQLPCTPHTPHAPHTPHIPHLGPCTRSRTAARRACALRQPTRKHVRPLLTMARPRPPSGRTRCTR